MDDLTTNYELRNANSTRWFRRPRFYVFIILLSVLGYFSFKLGSAYSTISIFGDEKTEKNDPNPLPESEPNRLDILILGIRGGTQKEIEEEGGLLADTIMVASIDRKSHRASLISIPRDLWIDVDGVKGKINQLYEKGLKRKSVADLPKHVVSRITGVSIDKIVVFDFTAFEDIVETLGGIDIYLAKPFSESTQWGYPFSLPAGNNHLDGEQALYYVRSRYSTSDFDRSRRQQEVITAIKNKLSKGGYLTNPVKITNLLSAIKGNIKTDFQIWDIKDVLDLANSFGSDGLVKNYVISAENLVYESRSLRGEYILLPKGGNYSELKNLFRSILVE